MRRAWIVPLLWSCLASAHPNLGALDVLLRRHAITLPPGHRQLLLVTLPRWNSTTGELQRMKLVRKVWRPVGRSVAVRIGAAGLGWGRGLHADVRRSGPVKREGDRRSPAGLFALGTALGPGSPPYRGGWPWRRVDARDRLVDDPTSPHYNTWQRAPISGRPAWRSAEKLIGYRLALHVLHNAKPVKRGAGSAIFIHLPDADNGPTVGCTTLPRAALLEILGWLDPAAYPLLLQLPVGQPG